MNIFYLDENIKKCAIYHVDKHVIKMILESTQMLSTALIINNMDGPYKATHIKHPCTQWASKSLENWLWLKTLTKYLNEEYMYRWNKTTEHKSYIKIKNFNPSNKNFPQQGITTRPQSMPLKYTIINNPIQAYRNYYLYEKKHLHKYTKRLKPNWLK